MDKEYAFTGRVIRLTKKDFESWQKAFNTIPDLMAELVALDAWLDEEKPKNWFATASALLNKRHQARVAQKSGFSYDEEDPMT